MVMRNSVIIAMFFLIVQALALYLLGQPAICECGYIKFWEGVVQSSGTSQHLTDWYTFSHLLHGFIFYLALWYFLPRLSVWQRFVIAVGIEVTWEVIENTPMVIEAYRTQALAQGYTGDSILNSLSDTLAMGIGFIISWRWPLWLVLTIAIGLEIIVALLIRDNLTLNILNFIHVFPAISAWQAG